MNTFVHMDRRKQLMGLKSKLDAVADNTQEFDRLYMQLSDKGVAYIKLMRRVSQKIDRLAHEPKPSLDEVNKLCKLNERISNRLRRERQRLMEKMDALSNALPEISK